MNALPGNETIKTGVRDIYKLKMLIFPNFGKLC